MLVSCFAFTACDGGVSQGLLYTLSVDGTSYIVSGMGTCKDTIVVIPSTYKELPVTGIDNGAFRDCIGLYEVIIPEGVTSIGYDAFSCCVDLTSITIPSTVTIIGSFAFCKCENLVSFVIPENVTFIDDCTFKWCTSLTSITIPSSVSNISHWAFYGCDKLQTVIFDDIEGWLCKDLLGGPSINLSLIDPIQNATYLKTTYCDYYWCKITN